MIDYSLVEELGFVKEVSPDKVYERQYGREYWYMVFSAHITVMGATNILTFTWDCDVRDVTVHKNETELVAVFTDAGEFKKFFKMFQT